MATHRMKILLVISGLIAVAVVVLSIAAMRWNAHTARQIANLDSTRPLSAARDYDAAQLHRLPSPDGWRPVAATETFVTQPAGFVWDARIQMAPGLPVRVRDGFVGGHGSMHASMLAVWPLASVENNADVAAGALHRYLAEAVWL